MSIVFNSVEELYNRLLPALKTKKAGMIRNGFTYIKEEDIWNYLKEIKWKKACDLELCEMVSDVLNTEDLQIDAYFKQKIAKQTREINFE